MTLANTQTHTVEEIYTDGCCIGNGKPGARAGYGVYFGDDRNLSGEVEPDSLPVAGHLVAVLKALREVWVSPIDVKYRIYLKAEPRDHIYVKSEQWSKNNWRNVRGKPIAHAQTLQDIRKLLSDLEALMYDVTLVTLKPSDLNSTGYQHAQKLARSSVSDEETNVSVKSSPTSVAGSTDTFSGKSGPDAPVLSPEDASASIKSPQVPTQDEAREPNEISQSVQQLVNISTVIPTAGENDGPTEEINNRSAHKPALLERKMPQPQNPSPHESNNATSSQATPIAVIHADADLQVWQKTVVSKTSRPMELKIKKKGDSLDIVGYVSFGIKAQPFEKSLKRANRPRPKKKKKIALASAVATNDANGP